MRTAIVNIPKKDEKTIRLFFRKLKLKSKFLSESEQEEMAIAQWINEGLKSEKVSEEVFIQTLKKRGVKI